MLEIVKLVLLPITIVFVSYTINKRLTLPQKKSREEEMMDDYDRVVKMQ